MLSQLSPANAAVDPPFADCELRSLTCWGGWLLACHIWKFSGTTLSLPKMTFARVWPMRLTGNGGSSRRQNEVAASFAIHCLSSFQGPAMFVLSNWPLRLMTSCGAMPGTIISFLSHSTQTSQRWRHCWTASQGYLAPLRQSAEFRRGKPSSQVRRNDHRFRAGCCCRVLGDPLTLWLIDPEQLTAAGVPIEIHALLYSWRRRPAHHRRANNRGPAGPRDSHDWDAPRNRGRSLLSEVPVGMRV
jgi:hypothetical protein